MRDHSHHIELSREDAVKKALEHTSFKPKTEEISILEATGRILAEDAYSQVELPNCLSSKMDSVAVRWEDFKDGLPDTSNWTRGVEWEFANTGTAMPEGFDTAIVVEHTEISEDNSSIIIKTAPSKKFAGTIQPGSRLKKGELLLKKGTKITSLLASHLASGGLTTVSVLKKPRVTFIPTGDELIPIGSKPQKGSVFETNSLVLTEKLKTYGAEPHVTDIIPDDPTAIKEALLQACRTSDIVIINAGSSKGSDDFTLELIEEIGTVLNHQVNHGPGHHCSYSVVENTLVIGVTGPPVGISFSSDFYVQPIVKQFLKQDPAPCQVKAKLISNFKSTPADKKKNKVLHGEDRPREVGVNDTFFTIRQMKLEVNDDGHVLANAVSQFKPDPVEANEADGYAAIITDETIPQPGDIITVDLRK